MIFARFWQEYARMAHQPTTLNSTAEQILLSAEFTREDDSDHVVNSASGQGELGKGSQLEVQESKGVFPA